MQVLLGKIESMVPLDKDDKLVTGKLGTSRGREPNRPYLSLTCHTHSGHGAHAPSLV